MKRVCLFLLFCAPFFVGAQNKLQPGFNGKEYGESLSLFFFGSSIPDSAERVKAEDPYHLDYRSKELGLRNNWSFYLRNDNVGAINIRGTVPATSSWRENGYSTMIAATGSLQLNHSTVFAYKLSTDPRATVHTGWTIALAFLAPEIE